MSTVTSTIAPTSWRTNFYAPMYKFKLSATSMIIARAKTFKEIANSSVTYRQDDEMWEMQSPINESAAAMERLMWLIDSFVKKQREKKEKDPQYDSSVIRLASVMSDDPLAPNDEDEETKDGLIDVPNSRNKTFTAEDRTPIKHLVYLQTKISEQESQAQNAQLQEEIRLRFDKLRKLYPENLLGRVLVDPDSNLRKIGESEFSKCYVCRFYVWNDFSEVYTTKSRSKGEINVDNTGLRPWNALSFRGPVKVSHQSNRSVSSAASEQDSLKGVNKWIAGVPSTDASPDANAPSIPQSKASIASCGTSRTSTLAPSMPGSTAASLANQIGEGARNSEKNVSHRARKVQDEEEEIDPWTKRNPPPPPPKKPPPKEDISWDPQAQALFERQRNRSTIADSIKSHGNSSKGPLTYASRASAPPPQPKLPPNPRSFSQVAKKSSQPVTANAGFQANDSRLILGTKKNTSRSRSQASQKSNSTLGTSRSLAQLGQSQNNGSTNRFALIGTGNEDKDQDSSDGHAGVEEDEEDTRVFHTGTMRQKAPAPGPASSKASTQAPKSSTPAISAMENLRTMHSEENVPLRSSRKTAKGLNVEGTAQSASLAKNVEQALLFARMHRGVLEVSIQIGQVIVQHPPHELISFFKAPQLEQAFSAHPEFANQDSCFTQMVTSRGIDVDYMRRRLVENKSPDIHEAYFEFSCLQADSSHVKVVISATDANTQPSVTTKEVMFGACYMHWPQRVFDGRLAVQGHRQLNPNVNKGISALVKSASPFRMDDLELPSIEARDSIEGMTVESVKLVTRMRYNPDDSKNVYIDFRRVHDLFISRKRSTGPNETGKFNAICRDDLTMMSDDRLWYEIKTGFRKPWYQLKENEKLNKGEGVDWEPEEVVIEQDVADLEELTSKMIVAMNDVGFNNQGFAARYQGKLLRKREKMGSDD